jgi:hypothetical protein
VVLAFIFERATSLPEVRGPKLLRLESGARGRQTRKRARPRRRHPVVAAVVVTVYLPTRRPTRGMAASTFFLAVGRSFS